MVQRILIGEMVNKIDEEGGSFEFTLWQATGGYTHPT